MEIEEKKNKTKTCLSKNIINYYSKYKNTNTNLVTQKVCGTNFELGD